jgi:hypothetical protein
VLASAHSLTDTAFAPAPCVYSDDGLASVILRQGRLATTGFGLPEPLGDDGTPLSNTLGTGSPRPAQEDFRVLNSVALATSQSSADYLALTKLWYVDRSHPNGVTDAGATFHFGQGAAQLGTFVGHTALYDHVVQPACRTCHISYASGVDTWASLTQMGPFIRSYACLTSPGSAANFTMPHAEVPFKLFWQQSLSSTLASELFSPPNSDCTY